MKKLKVIVVALVIFATFACTSTAKVSENAADTITHPRYSGYWKPYPIEYKHGHRKPDERDEVQLAAEKRLRKVAKECVNYGQRVQNSVFECLLTGAQLVSLKAILHK